MELCKTDVNNIIRLLEQASAFYKIHASSTRDIDKIRQQKNMIKKLNKKLKAYDKE